MVVVVRVMRKRVMVVWMVVVMIRLLLLISLLQGRRRGHGVVIARSVLRVVQTLVCYFRVHR